MNRLWWGWRAAPYGPGEVACAKTRAGFVDAVAEVFGPLVAGVAVVVVDEATAADPARLAEVVVGEGVTRLVGVPSLLSVLFEVAAEELRASRLVEVTASGEPLSGALVRRLRAVLAGCRVVNLYGSTEVAGDATAYVVPPGWEGERVPIGRPLDNLWVQVVGPAGEVVPVGVVGELVVGGPQVALGYVGEVEGDRFVADRWSGTTAPVYRTGDVGRWRADGVLEYVGRADRQVKVRGVRVEPGEVEAVLVAHPAVVEAAVVARPGVDGGVELVGFVVVAGAEVGADGVRGWLRARLVEQMVPAHLVVVAALPKLANGKVDRDALGSGAAGGDRRRPYEAPQGPDEQAVAAVFAELTGATRVGRHDDFFADLGGHSLLATRAVSRLRRPFGRDIPLRLLFEHPTVADLAPALAALAPTLDTAPAITAQPRERYRTTEVRR
jgi:acyl-coenzyme A synthetase/AMP-(fatty) acid ligase